MTQQSLFEVEKENTASWFSDALKALHLKEASGWPDEFGSNLLLSQQHKHPKDIRVLSLFSGAGGLDIGFHQAGFNIIECNEIEKDFASTLLSNSTPGALLSGSEIVCMDINDYDPCVRDIDFIIGGPPCQTFSAAGARAAGVNGTDDDRGNLFKQYVRILDKLKPKGFLFENVYRIVGAQGGKPWEQIQKAFSEVGYKLYWRILDAADYGVPQFRERLIIVGLLEGEYLFPHPTHGPDSTDNRPYYSASSALESVVSTKEGSALGGRHGHLLTDIPPGLNYSFYTDRMGHPTPLFGWRSKFSDYLYKADPNTPVRTIKAQGGQYTGPFHWENRTFSVEEIKRLQTFPDDYQINGGRQKAIHQLGNSVPPQFARILALSIAQQVFGRKLPFEVSLLPETTQLGFRSRKSKLTKVYAQKARVAIENLPKLETAIERPASHSRNMSFVMRDNLVLVPTTHNKVDYFISHEIKDGYISIEVRENSISDEDTKYHYTVRSNQRALNEFNVSNIEIKSYSKNLQSVTASWKYLELLIKQFYHKDDLIQFFGYYQYENNYSIQLGIKDPDLLKNLSWIILKDISEGLFVSEVKKVIDISEFYKVSESNLISEMKALKRIGFEIRSNNTNKQIKPGEILVPYSFPTLNERSLQRLKEL